MARWNKIGIIAGGGALPLAIANYCKAHGQGFHMVRLKGMADEACHNHPGTDCSVSAIGEIFRILRNHDCDSVVMAGIVQRPNFTTLRPDWRGAALMARLAKAAFKGDSALLAVLVDTFEAEGFLVVGAEEVLGNATPESGALGRHRPNADDFLDIRKAVHVVRALGPFDVGQGAVVSNGQVLAIEAAEGTDAMLARCGALQGRLSITTPSGVLVKIPKPGQELRVDLPTVGAQTIHNAIAAQLRGIALVCGAALMLERDEMRTLADAAGLFVYGFSWDEISSPELGSGQGPRRGS